MAQSQFGQQSLSNLFGISGGTSSSGTFQRKAGLMNQEMASQRMLAELRYQEALSRHQQFGSRTPALIGSRTPPLTKKQTDTFYFTIEADLQAEIDAWLPAL